MINNHAKESYIHRLKVDLNYLTKQISWYINSSVSDMGVRSTFGVINRGTFTPGGEPSHEKFYTDNLLNKIGRHRIIHGAMVLLSRQDYRKILAIYDYEYQPKYHKVIKNVFEDKTGLALILHDNSKRLESLCLKKRHSSLQPNEQRQIDHLIVCVNQEYDRLHRKLITIINQENKIQPYRSPVSSYQIYEYVFNERYSKQYYKEGPYLIKLSTRYRDKTL